MARSVLRWPVYFRMLAMENLRKNLLITLTAFVVGTVAWFALIYRPKHAELQLLSTKIKDLSLQVEGLLAQDRQIAGVQAEIDSTRQKIIDLETRIYPKAQLLYIIKSIEQRSQWYGLHFSAIMPDYDALLRLDVQQREQLGPLVNLPVEFTVQGNFMNFGRFVESVGTLPFLFSITKLNVEVTAESYPQVIARMEGVLYLTESPVTLTPKGRSPAPTAAPRPFQSIVG